MKNYLIVGADRGIGKAMCRQLASEGGRVLAGCLGEARGLVSEGFEVLPGVDVTSDAAMQELSERVTGVKIDVLLNVAGVYFDDTLDDMSMENVLLQMNVNALGPLRVIRAVRHTLRKGSKVGIVTSRMGSLADNGTGRLYGYRMSKAAANMLGVSLARDLEPQGIMVALLHPGMVDTDLVPDLPENVRRTLISPEDAAKGMLKRITALTPQTTGQFWHGNGEVLPW